MSEGVIYVASSEQFVKEAVTSARSIRKESPDLSIGIITNQENKSKFSDCEVFDDYIIVNDFYKDLRDKCFNIHQTPYDRTLYLDTDTYICEDISDIFILLDSFDFAATHAPVRESNKLETVPNSFPDLNGGMLLFKDNDVVKQVLNDWGKYYENQIESKSSKNPIHDQPPLRKSLYESEAKITILPPQYNCRYIFPGYIEGTVKILHGRDKDLSSICKKINRYDKMRVHTGQIDRSILVHRDGLLRYIPGFSMKKISYPTGKWEHRIRGVWKRIYK